VTRQKRETTHVTGLRVPNDIMEYIEEKIAEDVFSSRTHAIVRLLRIAIEVERDRAKIVHSYETGFSLSPKKEKE